jgi:hypothetical protein
MITEATAVINPTMTCPTRYSVPVKADQT